MQGFCTWNSSDYFGVSGRLQVDLRHAVMKDFVSLHGLPEQKSYVALIRYECPCESSDKADGTSDEIEKES